MAVHNPLSFVPRYIPFTKAGAAAQLQLFMAERKGEQSTGYGTAVSHRDTTPPTY